MSPEELALMLENLLGQIHDQLIEISNQLEDIKGKLPD